MTGTCKTLAIWLAGTAVVACNPLPNASQQDPELAKGQEDALSGKHGREVQAMARELEAMKGMSPEDQAKRLKELQARHAGK